MFREKYLVVVLFSIYLISSAVGEIKAFSAIFAFGDSVLDTGNNNYIFTLLKGNFSPYGRNFRYKKPTGRFGNGRVFTDIIAEDLGIKKLVPPYRKIPKIKPDDFKTGVCFASGGSGTDDLTSRTFKVLSAGDQVKDFKQYLKKLKKIVKDKKEIKEIVSNAVFLISEGNNDLGYFVAQSYARLNSPYTYTTKMVGWTKKFLKDLYDQGARKFAVMGVPPIGCMPMHRLIFGGVFGWCNSFMNKISEDFNTKLRKSLEVYGIEKEFKGAKFVYVDFYGTLMDLINHPKAYGFIEEKNGCCCMPTAIVPCKNPDKYVFYDFGHPSEKAYEVISKPLAYQIRKALA